MTYLHKCKMLTMYVILTFILTAWTSERMPKSIKNEDFQEVRVTRKTQPLQMKYILEWTSPYYPFKSWGTGQGEFFRSKCKITDCYVTSDRYLLESVTNFALITFHGPMMAGNVGRPWQRSPHQIYMFISAESAHNFPLCYDKYDNFFNWTWTYRLDSELLYDYVKVKNIKGDIIGPKQIMHWINVDSMKPISKETKKLLSTKNKLAAWFVSNCQALSKRLRYVARLRNALLVKYNLTLDIFGGCGDKQCPSSNMKTCLKMVQKEYYFYMSFENSFAEDYVTEKLLWALKNYAVPVVFGAANYTRFMPDGIYLHAGQMSPKTLAKEMHDIMKDKKRYYSFFKWHNHYSYHFHPEAPDSDEHCRICELLHNKTLMQTHTVYTHFRRWWNDYAKC